MPLLRTLLIAAISALALSAQAQTPPGDAELKRYAGLFAAAASDDATMIAKLVESGASTGITDEFRRTPLHVAAHFGRHEAARELLKRGADANALDAQRYDAVTIAAVRNDVEMLKLLLAGGASARNVTSPYDGTALIAAAHLGHAEVVRILIEAKAPLDHVNNLGWTAVIESIVLGDGGQRHQETLAHLVRAGANLAIADRQGMTPLALARGRRYAEIVRILEAANAR